MTAVARVLPRDWDGQRLLRFLSGLALLALAFAAHLTPAHLTPTAAAPGSAGPAAAVAAEPVSTGSETSADGEAAGPEPLNLSPVPSAGSVAAAEPLSPSPAVLAVGVMIVPAAPVASGGTLLTTVAAIMLLSGLSVRTYAVRGPPRR